MQGRKLAAAAALMAAAISFGAVAATGPKVGATASWDKMQKFEYYLGQLAGALNFCNSFDLSNRMRELADLSPYGRKGWASLLAFDDLRGGRCGSYAADAEEVLADRDKLWSYLTDKYDCPGGQCAPEGSDASPTATCRAEADEHLASLPLDAADIKSVRMMSRDVGATHVATGRDGHEAWVRLDSCAGWLIIDLSRGCYPRQSFTRGDCAVEGLSRY